MSGLDWRTPADAMPKDGEEVLVAIDYVNIGYDVVAYDSEDRQWRGNYNHYPTHMVEHWSVFPEAPDPLPTGMTTKLVDKRS